ncbi:MAG: peptidoglycan-associated lipoprotein [Gammaproteobacteria bacterium]|nr:MAG: peptidoglycan-associated lipoprotein [Gammaproteobacteria bacterium]
MKFKQWINVMLVGVAFMMAFTGCSSHKRQYDNSVNDANAAYSSQAQSSGVGDDASFGDQGQGSRSSLSKKVYYFDFDSDMVHEDDKPAINANANYLIAHASAKVMLEGHTDPRGSREYNIGLGERRAKAVAQMMIAKGVNPSQIRVVSYGAEKLASSGRSESDYQMDRRVVLVYLQR